MSAPTDHPMVTWPDLFSSIRDELTDWAGTTDDLGHVIHELCDARSLTSAQMEAMQSVDSLAQHMRQLAGLLHVLAGSAVETSPAAAAAIGAALNQINLHGLQQRLAGGMPSHAAESGTLELL